MKLVWDPEPMYFITELPWFNIMTSKDSMSYTAESQNTRKAYLALHSFISSTLSLCLTYLTSIFFLPLPSELQYFSCVIWVPAKEVLIEKAFNHLLFFSRPWRDEPPLVHTAKYI